MFYLYKSVLLLLPVELCLQHYVLDGIVARGGQVGDGTPADGGQHHVVLDQVVLLLRDYRRQRLDDKGRKVPMNCSDLLVTWADTSDVDPD